MQFHFPTKQLLTLHPSLLSLSVHTYGPTLWTRLKFCKFHPCSNFSRCFWYLQVMHNSISSPRRWYGRALQQKLLQLLRAYVTSQHDREMYLPYVLYAYRTLQHSSRGVSPFLLLYGRNPAPYPLATQVGYRTLHRFKQTFWTPGLCPLKSHSVCSFTETSLLSEAPLALVTQYGYQYQQTKNLTPSGRESVLFNQLKAQLL